MAHAAGRALTKPETLGLIRRAIARGDADRAALLTCTLAHRCRDEQLQRAQRVRRAVRLPGFRKSS